MTMVPTDNDSADRASCRALILRWRVCGTALVSATCTQLPGAIRHRHHKVRCATVPAPAGMDVGCHLVPGCEPQGFPQMAFLDKDAGAESRPQGVVNTPDLLGIGVGFMPRYREAVPRKQEIRILAPG